MNKVEKQHLIKYQPYFESYTYNIALIHAIFEGQYEGQCFVDDLKNPKVIVLCSSFMFHHVAGDESALHFESTLSSFILKHYLPKTNEKEFILFKPHQGFDEPVKKVFDPVNGIEATRQIFKFNPSLFVNAKPIDQCPYPLTVEYEQDDLSYVPYLVAKIWDQDTCISSCKAFVTGQKHTELDVFTHEAYRGQNLAHHAVYALISRCLEEGLTPTWSHWSYREASKALALKCGFEHEMDVIANVWAEAECGPFSK